MGIEGGKRTGGRVAMWFYSKAEELQRKVLFGCFVFVCDYRRRFILGRL